jgi:hypothetical protein
MGMKISDLPVQAQAKFSQFNATWEESLDAMRSASARIDRIKQAAAYDRRGGLNEAESIEVMRLEEKREKHRGHHQMCSRLGVWLGRLRNQVVVASAPVKSTQADGEDLPSYVGRLRDQICATQNYISVLESSIEPLNDRKQSLRNGYTDLLKQRGRPSRVEVLKGIPHVEWVSPHKQDILSREDVAAMIAWAFDRAELSFAACLAGELEPERDHANSASEREQKLAELRRILDNFEREEEQAICAAEDANIEIPRRQDASPACVLGVVVKAVRAAAA